MSWGTFWWPGATQNWSHEGVRRGWAVLPCCLLLLLLLLGVARGAGQLPCHSLGAINNVLRQPALTGPRCKNKLGARPWALPLPSQVGHGPIRGFFRARLGFCCAEPGSRLGQACNRDANVRFGFILYFFGAVLAFVLQPRLFSRLLDVQKTPVSGPNLTSWGQNPSRRA